LSGVAQASQPIVRGPIRFLAALLGGALLIVAFPPWGLWWVAPFAMAGLLLGIRQRTLFAALGTGWCAGVVFFAGHLPWMRVIGPDAWLLLSALMAAFWALAAVLAWCTRRLPGWPVWSALAFVAVEVLRSLWPWGGFPWGSLAYSQPGGPGLGWAWLIGATGLSAVIALAGGGIAWALERPSRGRRWLAAAAGLGGLVAGGAVLGLLAGSLTPVVGTLTTVIVQGNVPRAGLEFLGGPRQILGNHVRLTEQYAASGAGLSDVDLVVWPENSVDVDPFGDPAVMADVQRAADASGRPVLIGSPLINPADPGTLLNAGLLWWPSDAAQPGPAPPDQWYVKRRLVPFGEYIPHRQQLAQLFERFKRIPRDFVVGSAPGVIDVPRAGGGPAIPVGVVICFEIAYDDLVRDTVRAGGQVIVVQTNNATFARAGQTEQQLAMGQVRAAEVGRTVLIAATSGVSAVIDARGTVLARTEEMTPALLPAQAPLRVALTPAVRLGSAPAWAIALLVAGACLAAALRGSPGKRRRGPVRRSGAPRSRG